ncbi:MAG TPA: PepSY-associated TM helix domain-containing protein [Bryobacteraceae bacterium]|jgi:uncharacterized iron-regulated membrane protein
MAGSSTIASSTPAPRLTLAQRWLHRPQKIWLRRALFQVHLWSGLALGLYLFLMSVTGGVLVYRNELYRAATPPPAVSHASGPRLTDDQLASAALSAYPGYKIVNTTRALDPDQAIDIWLRRGDQVKKRMFDVRSGADLGDTVPLGIRLVSWLMDLHDNLLGGMTGRAINGIGAVAMLAVALTGIVVWWPGVKTWRRSLTVPGGIKGPRFNWHLHSMIGFWSLAFTLIFAVSGIYLAFPERMQDLADWLQPPTAANGGTRAVDKILYWLAFLHFGRIQGIGIPCNGPGVCDQTTKFVWAFFGFAPAAMFVTGTIMWWNRVLSKRK